MATDKRSFWDTIGRFGSALTGGGPGSDVRLSIERLERFLEQARNDVAAGKGNPALVAYLEQDIAEKKAKVEADIWEGGKQPGAPVGVIGSSTAGVPFSMAKYTPTQVVQRELMPGSTLPGEPVSERLRREKEMYERGSLFRMNPYEWYS